MESTTSMRPVVVVLLLPWLQLALCPPPSPPIQLFTPFTTAWLAARLLLFLLCLCECTAELLLPAWLGIQLHQVQH